ncbi:MAG: hypothetical protein LBM78_00825 [Clostridiales bacterium]|nr:hypothetical protein [Clostridiales bacterium]
MQVTRHLSSKYISGSGEAAAILVVPDVIQKGIEIGGHADHKNNHFETVTFAAKVSINGKIGHVAVVVSKTTDNFYKVHRILTPDGKVFEI